MDFYSHMTGATVARETKLYFVNPSPEVNGGIWTLFVAATAFLGLRIWSKIYRRHGLWWDDYILVASWIVLLASCILITFELATGYVVKTWDDRMTILVSVSSVLTTIGQAWSKTAFAVTLLRPGITQGWYRWILWFIVASLNIYWIVTFILQWTNYCGEGVEEWKIQGMCMDYDTIFIIKTGRNMYNIVTDFVLALFPWLVTWKLRIKRTEKIGICVTMSLGVIIAIISTWRTAWMMSGNVDDYDTWYFWRQGLSMIWHQAEVAGTIIVQTLPVIRHLGRDLTQQKTIVSVELNQVSNTTSKIWSKIKTEQISRPRHNSRSRSEGWRNLEGGFGGVESGPAIGLRSQLQQAPRSSWSTFSGPPRV